jgi:hypothetical protein
MRSNVRLAAALAMATGVALSACSAPQETSNDPIPTSAGEVSIPFSAPRVSLVTNQLAVCKYTVEPGSDINTNNLIGTPTSATVTVVAKPSGTTLAGTYIYSGLPGTTVSYPVDNNCLIYNIPAGTTAISVTEDPDATSALYFWRELVNGEIVKTTAVPGGPSTATFTLPDITVADGNTYAVYLKNVPVPPEERGMEGCTPGYWKQPQHFGSWNGTGYATGNDFDTVFGVNLFDPNITLLQALGRNGGGVNALARHATAALLNASSGGVEYYWTADEVRGVVQMAAAGSLSFEAAKDLLAPYNEKGCPLGRNPGN